ncbi:hypothetical protein [Metallosphaera hakonensis]|uniref:Uncharacterized protein n=1 Tax=Metallosphaera hakonensis JCM 8857 = DSM 7519 TaxID=1293036 RepID=A0A2U9IRG5_9CREN|nr:hypothetical protein [Metallosphaera hakonensis]AWR98576.1 hypothetical protein DFR87_01390 [Metallosphaera hakonensis JCM 8857 = DSM 7519]
MNKKLTQKDFNDFKEVVWDLIKFFKESKLCKENREESEVGRIHLTLLTIVVIHDLDCSKELD